MNKPTKKFSEEELQKIHDKALKNFGVAEGFWGLIYTRALQDVQMCTSSNQWQDSDIRFRDQDDKPTLTINMINRFYERITNAFTKLKVEIKVNSINKNKNPENAKILQGLMKSIEMDSSADVVYSTANQFQTSCGIGFARVLNEYEDDTSFDQVIRIKRVKDPFTVLPDPTFKTIDGSDMKFCFVIEDMTKDEYEDEYGEDACSDWPQTPSLLQADWFGERVRVAEYYLKIKEKETLVMLSNGVEVLQSEMTEEIENAETGEKETVLKEEFRGKTPIMTREVETYCVYWFKMDGNKILDYTKIPCKYIPVSIFIGKEVINALKRDFFGITQYLRDLQRQLNWISSLKNELIAMAPKAPWITAEGQTEKYSDMWDAANTYNFSRLIYTPKTLDDGTVAPPPTRVQFGPDIATLLQAEMQLIEQMKAITGIYDISDASMPDDTSGKAVLLKQESSENINISYIDHAKKSIEFIGKIIVDMAPKIYGSKELMRIIGQDGSVDTVEVPESLFDYNLARMDLTITTGKAFSNIQSEAAAQWLAILQYMPQDKASLILDVLIDNINIAGSEEASARLRRAVPPEILGDDMQNMSPDQMKQMIDAYKQQIDKMTQDMQALAKQVDDKNAELNTKKEIARLENETKLKVAEIESQTKHSNAVLASKTKMADSEMRAATDIEMAKVNKDEPTSPDVPPISPAEAMNHAIDAHIINDIKSNDNTLGV